MKKKSALKLIFLTPFIALLLSTGIYFVGNYPRSYINIVNFFDKKIKIIDGLFKEESSSQLQINEDELFLRLVKRMKRSTLVDIMTQKTALSLLSATVRVTADTSIGTGVILFDEKIDSIWYSYIITNSHVIKGANEVEIECFTYLKQQTISSITSYSGRVITNDVQLDLVLIQVVTPDSIGKEVSFETSELVTNLTLCQPVYVVGCALAKPPLVTNGHVAHISAVSSVITAFSIFGSSGGGVYTTAGELVGIVKGISMVHVPPKGPQIPEPALTHVILGSLIRSWLIVADFSFIIDVDSLITHQNFLDQQKLLILEQQEKKVKKAAEEIVKKAKKVKK